MERLSSSVCERVLRTLAQTRGANSAFSFKECLPELYCGVPGRMRWGGGRMKISALSHTRAVRLCVERRQIYFTEQLLWWTGNRGEKEQYKIKTRLLFWVGKFPISHNPALEWKTQKKIHPNVFRITELFWLTENTASYFPPQKKAVLNVLIFISSLRCNTCQSSWHLFACRSQKVSVPDLANQKKKH